MSIHQHETIELAIVSNNVFLKSLPPKILILKNKNKNKKS